MRVEEKKKTEEEVRERCKKLFDRFEGERGLHAKVKWRMKHFYMDPSVDPLMPGSVRQGDHIIGGKWQEAATQTTRVQDVFWKWKARVVENEWKVECEPASDTIPNRGKANEAEALLAQGFSYIREKTGIDVQANLTDAKGYKGVGILHWRIDESLYKEGMPDYDESDDEAGNMTEDDYDEESGRKKQKKYRESEDSLKERIARYKAELGFPVFMETLPMEQCAWERDKSTQSQVSEFAVKRVISNLGEWKQLKHDDYAGRARLSPNSDLDGTIEQWKPDSTDYENECTVTEYWTRDYWYEWAEHGDLSYFDSGTHIHGMPPFAIDPGRYTDEASLMWAYQPVFHSMLEEKPNYDRLSSLVNAAAEEAAIQQYVLQPLAGAIPGLTQDGDDPLEMNADSGAAARVPPGFRLEAVGGQGVNNQLFKLLEQSEARMAQAEPSTGFATFGAQTAPTSAWQEQAQENMEPKHHIKNTARALQVMVNNLIHCFAHPDGPGEVFGYGLVGDKLDRSTVLSRKPEEWNNIIAQVRIMAVGNVERAALEELGQAKLAGGLITDLEYIGDYEGKPNPEEVFVDRKAWFAYTNDVMPGQIRQSMAKAFGADIALAPGAIPMSNGQQVTDEEAIRAMGGQPVVPPPPPGGGNTGSGIPGAQYMQGAAPTTTMNPMPQPQMNQAAPV